MKTYTVLVPPGDGSRGHLDPMDVHLVKEGISWPALFIAPLWLSYQRMWLELIAYLVVVGAVITAGAVLGGALPDYAALAVQTLLALEANELRRAGFMRRGYRLAAITAGRTQEEAEIRYFTDQAAQAAMTPQAETHSAMPSSADAAAAPHNGEVIGLFPTPEGTAR